MSDIFIGIDLGGTNIKFGCFDTEINLVSKTSTPTAAEMGPEAVVEKMTETISELLEISGLSLTDVCWVGIGTPGPARYKEGIIISATNMPEFINVPIVKMLSESLAKPVVLENDANTACFGEYTVGAGKGVKDMVFFTLGTGVGGAIICNGSLVHGFAENAAELGHVIIYPDGRRCSCGQEGCVEAYASADSTARRATEALEAGAESSLKKVLEQNGEITSKDIYEHLDQGDELAKKITDETAKALAILCVNMVHVTEPQRIVFAGGMIAAGKPLLKRIQYYFKEQIWNMKDEPLDIRFADLGEDAGITGAAALAKQAYQKTT